MVLFKFFLAIILIISNSLIKILATKKFKKHYFLSHPVVDSREESSLTEDESSDRDSERFSTDEFNDGMIEFSGTDDELSGVETKNNFLGLKSSDEMTGKMEKSTEEESFDDDEIWSEFNEALETTLTNNLDEKITEQQAFDLITNFNKKKSSIGRSKMLQNLYTPPPYRSPTTGTTTNLNNSDKSMYFTPMTSTRSENIDEDLDEFQTPRARPVLKRSSTESKVDVDASSIRERQMQRYNEMKEYHRQQAKLKSDQELEQKHPSNRSSVPTESILYRLHNAYSNDDDGKTRARLDEPETTKLSILDYMPSLQKVGPERRRSRTRSRSPPPPSLPLTLNQKNQKPVEKRAGSDEPYFYSRQNNPYPLNPNNTRTVSENFSENGGVFSRIINIDDDGSSQTKISDGQWFESSPSPNQLRYSESQKEANMLDRMRRLKIRNAERRATVAVNLDRERQKELEKMRRNEQIQEHMDKLREQQEARNFEKRINLIDGVQIRPDYGETDPTISISTQNIKRAQRQAKKIIAKREQDRQRTAQDIQRGLDETENRISEVFVVGTELEIALEKDPQNSWLLENWLLYVQELLQLQLKEDDLNMRVKEISVAEQYRQLKLDLQELQSQSGGEIGPDIGAEKELMEKIIRVLNEHNRIKAEMDTSAKTHRRSVFDVPKILETRGRSYENFEPVFSMDKPEAYRATQRILAA